MKSKNANRIFLSIILLHIAVVFLLTFLSPVFEIGIVANFILSQSIILIPAVMGTILSKENVFRFVGFRKIKLSTVFSICIFAYLCMPLTTLVNMLSLFFVDNTVAAMSGQILDVSIWGMLAIIGIFGPLSEEFVFRGIIYQGYKRSGATLRAILLSALLFSLMHMNFNQAAYAFVIGVIIALLVEATGSLWSSVLFHVIFNSSQVGLMYFSDWLAGGMENVGGDISSAQLSIELLLVMLSGCLLVAAVTTTLAGCVLVWIAKNEGREEDLRAIWKDRKQKRDNMVTAPLLVAIAIAFFYMGLEAIIPYAIAR